MPQLIANLKTPNCSKKRLNLIYHIYISTCANGKRASAIETGHYTLWDQTRYKIDLRPGSLLSDTRDNFLPSFSPASSFLREDQDIFYNTMDWIVCLALCGIDFRLNRGLLKQIYKTRRNNIVAIKLNRKIDSVKLI